MNKRRELRRFVTYAMVGLSGTGAQYAVYVPLVHLGGRVLAASLAGYSLGAVVNYFLNRRFTFGSGLSHRDTAPRFFFVALFGLCLNAAIVFLLFERLKVHYLLSQLAATALCLLATYALNAMWSFNGAEPATRK